jgi:segregation and condensation protein B
MTESDLKPIIESLIYLAEEPVTEASLLEIVGKDHKDLLRQVLASLVQDYQLASHGIEIREVANGYRMATKAEHHEWVRKYVKTQTPPPRLSLAALETLAVIAYKQPITIPEIQEIRGVNAVGVLKNLIDKNLVTPSGRKNVVGRPILYRTTKEFLLHFGLKNLNELPSLEEFEELAQAAMGGLSSETPVVPPPDGTETAEREFLSSPSGTIEQAESLENPSSDEAAGEVLSDIVPDSSEPQGQEHAPTTPSEGGGFSSSQRS